MNSRAWWVAVIVVVLTFPLSATADTLYATYQTLASTGGIARFDADTLEFLGNFDTPNIPTGVAYGDGSVYDMELHTIFRRDPVTGAQEAHNGTEFDSFAFYGGNVFGAAHFTVGAKTAVAYQLLDGQTLSLVSGQLARNVVFNEFVFGAASNTIYGGGLLYASPSNMLAAIHPEALLDGPGNFPLETTVGGDVSFELGMIGPLALGGGYLWTAFSGGALGPGVLNFDPATVQSAASLQGFFTSTAVTGLVYGKSSLYYSQFGVIDRRDPVTNALLGNSQRLPVILGALALAIPPSTADFNEDGQVDLNDLAAWQAGFGAATGALHWQGDADSDADVDGADFLLWQLQLGSFTPVGAANSPVPEPATLLHVIVAAGCIRRVGGRMRQ